MLKTDKQSGPPKSGWTGLRGRMAAGLMQSNLRAAAENLLWKGYRRRLLGALRDMLPTGAETVVDMGAGSGYYSLPLAEMLPKGTLYSLDLSMEMLGHLEKIARRRGLMDRLRIIKSEAAHSGLPEGSVELAFSSFLLHETPSPLDVMREMHRVLKPGGRIGSVDFTDKSMHRHLSSHGCLSAAEMEEALKWIGFIEVEVERVRKLAIAYGRKQAG